MDDFIWSDPPSRWAFPMATAGYPLLLGAGFVTLVLAQLGLTAPTVAALVATFCIAGFFRDPDRVIPNRPGIVVSPADGRIISVERIAKTAFFDGPCYKISIFMSVFNVHVNRIPAEGRVSRISYRPGHFFAADRSEASLSNEHNAVFLETAYGRRLCVVQVAGWIARRIICRVQGEETVRRGQRFGMICFGSRLDVYLPPDLTLMTSVGDKVKAGVSVLGGFPELAGNG